MDIALTMESIGLNRIERPLEGVLAFLASRSKKSARELSVSAGEVFDGVAEIVDQLLMNVIEKRTAAEFETVFADVFPKYVVMTLTLSHVAKVVVPPDVIERLTRESICEMEADFRDKALPAFGAAVRDQAMFTIWTLRKINDLVAQISAVKLDDSKREEDDKYCRKFNFVALRAHFSLDCLNIALRLGRPIYPEIMEEVTDGLRSMVNAYTWARLGAALRVPTTAVEPSVEPDSLDLEDEELLRASMQDMASMSEDEGH
jgi:hypothetical protein